MMKKQLFIAILLLIGYTGNTQYLSAFVGIPLYLLNTFSNSEKANVGLKDQHLNRKKK